MILRWLPWKFIVKKAARRHGFIDPVRFLARLRRFSQPSEVQEPIELIRAGITFHARGLVNTKAIQNNLDWVWPMWVNRQFDPNDDSFIPRAFSFSHINLTHRNWTAVGQPGSALYALVDPQGLVMPAYESWSLDFWVIGKNGSRLFPSRLREIEQELLLDSEPEVITRSKANGLSLVTRARSRWTPEGLELIVHAEAGCGAEGGELAAAVRPMNAEGIQFLETLKAHPDRRGLDVDGADRVLFDRRADSMAFSNYAHGDVVHALGHPWHEESGHCKVGLATAAACFRAGADGRAEATLRIPLREMDETALTGPREPLRVSWADASAPAASLSVPDKRIQRLYDTAVHTLVLLSAEIAVPGPATYRRFWFRDACLMLNALLLLGLRERGGETLREFARRQKHDGYFHSQEGEWDSNGQVLWVLERLQRFGERGWEPDAPWLDRLRKGVRWIGHKRRRGPRPEGAEGLFPPGFSAEHLGPNDYYFWDDFWGLAGLRNAARLFHQAGAPEAAREAGEEANAFDAAISASIQAMPARRSRGGIPASPLRRMDSGAIGSMVADYPLQLTGPEDERMRITANWLLENCLVRGGFFQDMIHSGINAYLTLDLAQTLLRQGDSRYRDLLEAVAGLASPTGQWPEAIHPRTLGGCMGDGQHGWAAAEWALMVRALFVREEGEGLVLGSGLFPEWVDSHAPLRFGPAVVPGGSLTITVEGPPGARILCAEGSFRGQAPAMTVAVPGHRKADLAGPGEAVKLQRDSDA